MRQSKALKKALKEARKQAKMWFLLDCCPSCLERKGLSVNAMEIGWVRWWWIECRCGFMIRPCRTMKQLRKYFKQWKWFGAYRGARGITRRDFRSLESAAPTLFLSYSYIAKIPKEYSYERRLIDFGKTSRRIKRAYLLKLRRLSAAGFGSWWRKCRSIRACRRGRRGI